MVVKKALLALFFLTFLSFVSANTITLLKVSSEVALDEPLAVYGTYSADSNNGVLCSFRIFNDSNFLVIRLSDEYTFTDGTFSTEYMVGEPLFHRGETYRVNATCSTATKNAYFKIGQKETFYGMNPDIIMNDFKWWTDSNNSFTTVAFMVTIIVLIGGAYLTFKQL